MSSSIKEINVEIAKTLGLEDRIDRIQSITIEIRAGVRPLLRVTEYAEDYSLRETAKLIGKLGIGSD